MIYSIQADYNAPYPHEPRDWNYEPRKQLKIKLIKKRKHHYLIRGKRSYRIHKKPHCFDTWEQFISWCEQDFLTGSESSKYVCYDCVKKCKKI